MTVNPSRDETNQPPYDPFGPDRAHQHAEDINVWHRDLLKGWDLLPECGCTPTKMCFKHKLRTIQFNGKGPTAPTLMEKQWDRDRPAYQRLRAQGLQPKSIKGSADLEGRANSQLEVELGHVFDKRTLPKVEESMAIARDMEWQPNDPDVVAAAKAGAAKPSKLSESQKAGVKQVKDWNKP